MKLIIYLILLVPFTSHAKIWYVVQGSSIPDPKTAASLAQNGDTVDIAYAVDVYLAYETKWPQNNLLIRGSGAGQPVLKAESFSVTQKAIFVTQGNDITIENIHFTNCKVPDQNGAGIRSEGVNLTVSHCSFSYNEMGILAGDKTDCTILVEYSVFGYNGYGDGYSHNIYINHVQKFIFRHNYSHDCTVGHLLKSRAHETYILYNRLDSPGGYGPSREIDVPNGGQVVMIGNVIRKTVNDENSNMIGYGLEGLNNPAPHEIYMVNNTLINEKTNGSFIQCQSGTSFLKAYNNILGGGGSFFGGTVPGIIDTASNLRSTDISQVGFVDPANQDYHLQNNSWAINKGSLPGVYGSYDLTPAFEYVDDASTKDRINHYPIDIGAFETEGTTSISGDSYVQSDKIIVAGSKISFRNIAMGTSLLVSNMIGNVFVRRSIAGSDIIDMSLLPRGIYTITLISRDTIISTRKLIRL